MSLEFKKNKNTMNGLFLTEEILKTDLVATEEANGITDAVTKHLIYYLSSKFDGVIFKTSDTSSGTSVTFVGKYPESRVIAHMPIVSIYTDIPNTRRMSMGSIIGNINGNLIRGNNAKYNVTFDIWGRTAEEMNIINGYVKQILDDSVFDDEFIFVRGFNDVIYQGSSNREFDIADNYVNDVSHLDSSIRYKRNQLLYEISFTYRLLIETMPTEETYELDPTLQSIATIEGDMTTSVSIQSTGFNINFG
jgi:hypothetical protein